MLLFGENVTRRAVGRIDCLSIRLKPDEMHIHKCEILADRPHVQSMDFELLPVLASSDATGVYRILVGNLLPKFEHHPAGFRKGS